MSDENSIEAEDAPKELSVYDFVYVDSERIAATLSQFDNFGHLSKLTHQLAQKGANVLEGSIAGVVKGSLTEDAQESIGKEYNPTWLAPLNFLDELAARGILQTDIAGASLGQFVLATGQLSVVDLSLLHGMWSDPAVKKLVISGADDSEPENRQQRRSNQSKSSQTKTKAMSDAEVALAILAFMPHYLQATINSQPHPIWFNMTRENLKIPSGDFTLKHGPYIPGDWHVVGILDARPDDDYVNYEEPVQNVLGTAFSQMSLPVRFMMGRPVGTFGITPIIVFRQVATTE